MANFPVPPARRIAYDRDDTQVFYFATNISGINEMSQANMEILNNEDDDLVDIFTGTILNGQSDDIVLAFLFSQDVQLLDAQFIHADPGAPTISVDVEWSDDTTNGRDGTWTQEAAGIGVTELTTGIRPAYRQSIAAIGGAAAHPAWRFFIDPTGAITDLDLRCVHLYAAEHGPTNRLSFWDPALDQELAADPDFEDNARGTRVEKTFRMKNVSSQTANGITLDTEQGPSHGRPDTWTLLSTDGVTFSTQISLGNLGPGTVSGLIYLRCDAPVNAEILTLSSRVLPTVTSYS